MIAEITPQIRLWGQQEFSTSLPNKRRIRAAAGDLYMWVKKSSRSISQFAVWHCSMKARSSYSGISSKCSARLME